MWVQLLLGLLVPLLPLVPLLVPLPLLPVLLAPDPLFAVLSEAPLREVAWVLTSRLFSTLETPLTFCATCSIFFFSSSLGTSPRKVTTPPLVVILTLWADLERDLSSTTALRTAASNLRSSALLDFDSDLALELLVSDEPADRLELSVACANAPPLPRASEMLSNPINLYIRFSVGLAKLG